MSGVVDVLFHPWFLWVPGVVDVWCGGCPVWWMSGVVDVLFYTWCGGCPVWWMSSVVDVLFYTRCGGCLVWWMSVWWMSYNPEFLPNSAIETQKTQKLGAFAEILPSLEPLIVRWDNCNGRGDQLQMHKFRTCNPTQKSQRCFLHMDPMAALILMHFLIVQCHLLPILLKP